jgi:PAS domain S-box-containing protein
MILAIFLVGATVSAKPLNVLVLHSYQQEFPETKLQHNGFVKGLRGAYKEKKYNIFTEYLNAKTTHAYTESPETIDKYIQSKYILNKPDIVYATNDEAAAYLSKTSLGYLKEIPLVLSGVTDLPMIDRTGDTSAVIAQHNINKIISMVNTLIKGEPDIHFIDSGGKSTWDIREDIDDYKKTTGTTQRVTMDIELDIDKLLASIRGGKDSVYIIANAGGFYSGDRHETLIGALKKIKQWLPSPYIFCMSELEVREGILGGYVNSSTEHGKQAGRITAMLLSGESPGNLIRYPDSKYVFDRTALEAAGLTLPEEILASAEVFHEHPGFIEEYGRVLVWVIIILVTMMLIVAVTFSMYSVRQHKRLMRASRELSNLSRQNQQYIDAVDASNLVSVADTNGRLKYINDTYLTITGYTRAELIGRDHRILNSPELNEKAYDSLISCVTQGQIWLGILKNKTKQGDTIYLETSVAPIKDENGVITEFLSIRKDITQLVNQQKEIQSQYTDALTTLPNRIKMRLDRNNSTLPAVALLNIDGFSIINTFYGMEAGDYLLKAVAEKIRELLPKGMSAYRISGDEFGILSHDTPDYQFFNSTIQKIMENISFSSFIYEQNEMHFTLTAGTSLGRATTITRAGIALRQARLSKKSFMTYDDAESEMEKIRDTVLYSGSLRYALTNNRIIPYFQPITDTQTGQVVKYEALMRIEEESGNILTPEKFLYMSKKLKLYNALSMKMMEKTLTLLSTSLHSTCINFDIEDVMNTEFQNRFFHLVNELKLQGRITVEITESEGTDNMDEVAAFLAKARQHGCLIAIDDFGTGYSNFMYILSLQPDFLKIDGSITRQINVSPRARLLTQTIADMCRQAGIKTVAEYVSSEDIHDTIKEVGIDYCQGYLFGKPAPDFKIKL